MMIVAVHQSIYSLCQMAFSSFLSIVSAHSDGQAIGFESVNVEAPTHPHPKEITCYSYSLTILVNRLT